RLRVKGNLQKGTPVLQQTDENFPQGLAGVIGFPPSGRIDFQLLPCGGSQTGVYEPGLDLWRPKVDEFFMMRAPPAQVIEKLRIVLRHEAGNGLQLVNGNVSYHQVQIISLGKVSVRYSHWQLRSDRSELRRLQPRGQVILINDFVAEPPQLVLGIEGMMHH